MSAKTVTENWVPMWVKKPSRVPGRSHTVRTLSSVSPIDIVCALTAVLSGEFLTRSRISTIDNTPSAATEA